MFSDVRNAPDASEDASSSAGAQGRGKEAPKPRKRRRARAGRIAYSHERDRALAALYRFGGLTARQLASWLEIVEPGLRDRGGQRMPRS
ncbi:MAG: hypothetical protein M3P49_14180, partial [Actinomycetota bacterium]|nr:hypothetical protein [Actinomycetota bacterium]